MTFIRAMLSAMLVLTAGTLIRCATVHASTEAWAEEGAFQALHLVDLQQTLDIKRQRCNPIMTGPQPNDWTQVRCAAEGMGLLDAGWATGPHPSDRSIYSFMGVESIVHAGVTWVLDRYEARWPLRLWQAVTIGIQGATIARNFSVGLKVRF